MTQGDIISPIIFNIMIDATTCAWAARMEQEVNQNNREDLADLLLIFYADDGHLASPNAELLQQAIDTLTTLLAQLGLHINTDKTNTMVTMRNLRDPHICGEAYDRKV